jgi:tRNA pseudouridine13 synthase
MMGVMPGKEDREVDRKVELPYLTSESLAIAGVYKARWEDFRVEELPAREPAGHGDHTWFEVEKHGLTTATAVADLARALGVKPSSVGYAGLKDARAIARQWLSVEHVEPARVLAVEIPRIRVLRAERHNRKLRRGWHVGNRFEIRVRETAELREGRRVRVGAEELREGRRVRVGVGVGVGELRGVRRVGERIWGVLGERGVPNYYGPQRFGSRGDTWRVGRALARGEWGEAASLIAGRPLRAGDAAVAPAEGIHPDRDDILRARELYDAGRYGEASATWPRGFGAPARLAAAMERTGGDASRSLQVVGKGMLRLYASAYQAWLFNRVLARRIDTLDRLIPGDLAWKHDTEALFHVPDPATEQGRATAFQVSPTGPLVGRRLPTPSADAGALEAAALEDAGFDPAELESRALRPFAGRRRPLRFLVRELGLRPAEDDVGPYLELRFALPPGCYATAVLRELGKGLILER